MRKIIISMENCSKCKVLREQNPDAESVELPADKLLMLARELNIQSLPIIVLTGEPQELADMLDMKKKFDMANGELNYIKEQMIKNGFEFEGGVK